MVFFAHDWREPHSLVVSVEIFHRLGEGSNLIYVRFFCKQQWQSQFRYCIGYLSDVGPETLASRKILETVGILEFRALRLKIQTL